MDSDQLSKCWLCKLKLPRDCFNLCTRFFPKPTKHFKTENTRNMPMRAMCSLFPTFLSKPLFPSVLYFLYALGSGRWMSNCSLNDRLGQCLSLASHGAPGSAGCKQRQNRALSF